ncbi:DnaJ like subfamily C member 3 [Blastomyces dermatitidis ATCC 18188]|uniref:Tetratricopeptide repeat and J domain-containing co-chaperone DNJ1 n=1 Tax=Ajellomyces dermatitidis (strain ATCC 18188 / CBS 674.68) TaxID=653446 RepID=F2TSS8_AJEDA|nr:DnaJ like subfamily C member 3 [Blastomyces dermatitidis ATCC 18188]
MILRLQSLAILFALLSAVNGLQPSDIPSDTPLSSLISTAKSYLKNGAPQDALPYFDVAISRDPTNYLTIFQRGATYLSLGKNAKALLDFNDVLKIKPDFEGALIQRARIKMKSADWDAAKRDLAAAGKNTAAEIGELNEAREASRLAEAADKKGDWDTCVLQSGVAIMKASQSLPLRQLRARCRFERGDIQEGINDLAHVLQMAPGSVEPHLKMSSMLFYSLADTERGITQVRKCLHSDPDSKACSRLFKKEKKIAKQLASLESLREGRKLSKVAEILVGNKEDAGLLEEIKDDVRASREAGHIHPKAPDALYTNLLEKTCETYRQMKMKKKAQSYCTEALKLIPNSLHGLLSKAEAQIDTDDFEAAIQTLKFAREHHDNSQDIQSLYQKAHTLLKRSKQKDYYKVLGVDRDADDRTIKRAYRKMTKQFHPDKAMSQGVSKEDAEKKMAAINEAYEVLSDPELRARFDRGDDPNSQEGQGNPFQGSPFGHHGGHGQQFFFQQGGGGPHFKFSGGGFNFPGGFPFG